MKKHIIVSLERDRWQDYRLPLHYVSHHYYDVDVSRSVDDFHVSFVKRPLSEPYEHLPDDSDKLFQPWWDDIQAWGILDGNHLIAAVETAVEEWSNRLRVTELWIDDAHRRQGLGRNLMDQAMRRARQENRRVLMLETQSCNANAIAFYLAYGFTLIGFNICEYSNNDLRRKQVRLELGILL